MADNIPDLNDTFVEPLFYYNIGQGYMCPDSVDGFDYPNGLANGDVITSYVRIPFDQDIADSHVLEFNNRKEAVVDDSESVAVVEEVEDEEGFKSWLDGKLLGVNLTPEEMVKKINREKLLYESWKDNFVIFCPAAMGLPGYKGGLLLISLICIDS